MHVGAVVPVRDVDPLVPRNGVRIDGQRRRDAVLPFLLHLCVHDQQRVVWQVDRDLPFRIDVLGRPVVRIFWEDPANSEFTSHAQGYRSYYGARAQICELVTVPANALLWAIVTVHKR